MSVHAYKRQKMVSGWTRIELLLYLYDRAITSLEACETAKNSGDEKEYGKHFLDANKTLLAIHAGLKPEDEIAFNVARLLHFVSQAVIANDFQGAVKVLRSLRDGFAAIEVEANQLESSGQIPSAEKEYTFRV